MAVEIEPASSSTSFEWAKPWTAPIVCLLVGLIVQIGAFAVVEHGFSLGLLPDAYCRWDCSYYLSIAADNYQAAIGPVGEPDWAFFPTLPAAIALLHFATQLDIKVSAAIVASLATLLASRLAFSLCASRRQHWLFCAAVCFGPAALYFLIPYSESMFLLFTVLLAVQLRRNNPVGAGISGAALSATRAVGIFAGAAILVDLLSRFAEDDGRWRNLPRYLWRRPDVLLALAVVPLGIGVFSLILYLRTGDGLAFSHVQRLWNRIPTNPSVAIWHGLQEPGQDRADAIAALLGVAGSIVLLIRREYAMGVFCFLCVVSPLLFGLDSMYRFVIALPPFWLLLADWFGARRWTSWVGLAALLVGGFATDVAWLSNVHYLV